MTNVPQEWKSFWAHPIVLLANGGQEEACLEIVLILSQDRCTVCTECTTCMEIALGTPEWYSEVMYVEWKLVLVRIEIVLVSAKDRCPVCAECTSGIEIALGTPK